MTLIQLVRLLRLPIGPKSNDRLLSSGIVWLEHDHEDGESRAVTEIYKGTPSAPFSIDYRREFLALSQLSKVSNQQREILHGILEI